MTSKNDIIGFVPIYRPQSGQMNTRAQILCTKCADVISSNGGPKANAICVPCAVGVVHDSMMRQMS